MALISPEPSSDFLIDTLDRPLEIVFEDEHFAGVFKPAGLMVHRGPRTLPSEPVLLQALRDQLGRFLYPIHRLDRPTAGLILFAFSKEGAARLGQLFSERQIVKHYQALVRGFFPGEIVVDRPLADQVDNWLLSGGAPDPTISGGDADDSLQLGQTKQEARTHFRCLETLEVDWATAEFSTSRFSLVEVQPHTGRWHQIRRHLNHLAHPVIGDHRHGDHRWNQRFYERTGVYRMLLTAMRLDFRHPFSGEPVSILVPRGESFDRGLHQLRSAPAAGK